MRRYFQPETFALESPFSMRLNLEQSYRVVEMSVGALKFSL